MVGSDLSRRRFLAGMAGVAALGTAGCAAIEAPAQQSEPVPPGSNSRFVDLYDQMAPSVLEIHLPGPTDPMEPAGGSGFYMEDIGIVTNAHVVPNVDEVELRFHDRVWREGTVVETDPHSDLAVIDTTAPPAETRPLPFGTDVPPIGTETMAIGSPFGLGGSASTGIVSGVGRVLPSPTGFGIPAAIQTDAAVNPGNSGGPLVDLDGNVIGVVFAGATENIGFAISGPLANRVLPVLADGDAYEHPYVGLFLVEVGPELAETNELPEPRGIYVDRVEPGGPSDGILQGSDDQWSETPSGGDVIVQVDDVETAHLDDFQTYLALETRPGEIIDVELYRDGSLQTEEIELGVRPT